MTSSIRPVFAGAVPETVARAAASPVTLADDTEEMKVPPDCRKFIVRCTPAA